MKNLIIFTLILFTFTLIGCINESGNSDLIGKWELIVSPEIVMILNDDGTTNVWYDPELAEKIGDNFESKWSIKDDWIYFNYNFSTYEKNYKFKYEFQNNGNLVFNELAFNIEYEFKKI